MDGGCKLEMKDDDKKRIQKIEEDVFQLVYNESKESKKWIGDLKTNKNFDFKISSRIRKSFYYYERNNKDGLSSSFFSFK